MSEARLSASASDGGWHLIIGNTFACYFDNVHFGSAERARRVAQAACDGVNGLTAVTPSDNTAEREFWERAVLAQIDHDTAVNDLLGITHVADDLLELWRAKVARFASPPAADAEQRPDLVGLLQAIQQRLQRMADIGTGMVQATILDCKDAVNEEFSKFSRRGGKA